MSGLSFKSLVLELRRRRTFRTAGLYIVTAWLAMQAADVFFPAWGLPDGAINALLVTAILGFPLAVVFGWFFDITADGIVRTPAAHAGDSPEPLPLQRKDYVLLGALGLIAAFLMFEGVLQIASAPRSATTPAIPAAELAPKAENSVAVLPFVNTSNDPGNEAFCDGVSEEILHRLSNYAELRVIGRTSSFAFKGSDYGIPRIAALLGARYLLQGSVRRDGDNLRILASLVDDAGVQRWSSSYDRKLDNVFALQDEIAEVVANTVIPQIVSASASNYEPGFEAYQQYLIGRDFLSRRDGRAVEAFTAATDLDPNFAAAYAELAIALSITTNRLEEAHAALETALALEPGLPRALAAKGLLSSYEVPTDHARTEQLLHEALAKNPDDVDVMNWLGGSLRARGEFYEGARILERAARIDPLHGVVVSNLATHYLETGDPARAEQMLLRLIEVPTPARNAFLQLRNLYLDMGRLVEMNALEKRQALAGVHVYYGLALNYAVLGLWDEAARWTELTQEDFPDFRWAGMYPSLVPYWHGRYAEAAAQFPKNVDMPRESGYFYGAYQALAGDVDGAIATLEPLLRDVEVSVGHERELTGLHALAWVYLETGRQDEAYRMLGEIDRMHAAARDRGLLHGSAELFWYAQNAVLLGNHAQALDRLEMAVDAGWRQYMIMRHDPRWTVLEAHPRYVSMMERVMADVERQRAEVERIDAADDFMKRFEVARQLRQ